MAVSSGPKITKDGLVLYLDAANFESFRGEEATNLLPVTSENTYKTLNTANSTYGPISLVNTSTPYGNQAHQITFKTNADNGFYSTNTCRFTSSVVTVQRDSVTIYKYSVWVYVIDERWSDWNSKVYKYVTGTNGWPGIHDLGERKKDSYGRIWRRYGRDGHIATQGGTGNEYHTFFKNGTLTEDLKVLLVAPDFYGMNRNGIPMYTSGSRGTTVATGGGWADMTNNGNHGELINGVSYDSGSLGALSFDGVNDNIDFGNILQLGTDSRTYCCWYKNDATSSAAVLRTLISKTDNGSTQFRQSLGFDSSGNFSVILRGSGNTNFDMNTTNPKNDTNWHFLSWVIDRTSNQYLYQDVILLNSRDISSISSQNFQLNRNFRVGSYSTTANLATLSYSGLMSNVMVFNRALSQAEIKQIYEATRARYGL